jgi:hypothetical protein
MAPSIKHFATLVLVFESHVAQKCVLEGAIPSTAMLLVTIVKWKAKSIFDVAAILLYS